MPRGCAMPGGGAPRPPTRRPGCASPAIRAGTAPGPRSWCRTRTTGSSFPAKCRRECSVDEGAHRSTRASARWVCGAAGASPGASPAEPLATSRRLTMRKVCNSATGACNSVTMPAARSRDDQWSGGRLAHRASRDDRSDQDLSREAGRARAPAAPLVISSGRRIASGEGRREQRMGQWRPIVYVFVTSARRAHSARITAAVRPRPRTIP
jgi:hypothetical protein